MMLTLTLDPQHFASPQAAFEHVEKTRCVSVTMQALRRSGWLLSERWFAVIEWQENGWPHWHVLVEAGFLPVQTVRDAWNVNLHKLHKEAADTRTGLGSVRFSPAKFADPSRAAGYACAYLTRHPKNGYPQWVLDSPTRKVHRYSASRGFWGQAAVVDESAEMQSESEEPAEMTLSIPKQKRN